jgi:extracellular factor (EF) 3-hydroxypalmitic acid methyl ester biosynthesis protein
MKGPNLILRPEERDSLIVCRTSQGYDVRATPLRILRHVVAFEVYNPYSLLQLSEVLREFRIFVGERLVYSGRATVSSLVNTGIMLVCEATLEEAWLDVDLFALITEPRRLRADFAVFLHEWGKIYNILPQYKVILADIQTYFSDLKRWLDQVELGIRSSPSNDRLKLEVDVIHELAPTILPSIDSLFAKFEEVAENVGPDLVPHHRNYAKRQLHPHLLCSPFAYRTYHKPLGYAGDYEMVNMIVRDPAEGSSLFSKTINLWMLSQAPAVAHRNRIQYLTGILAQETRRVTAEGRPARIFNLGCGPAREIQTFLADDELSDRALFTLLDFNDETLQHTGKVLRDLVDQMGRKTGLEMLKKSVHQVLKEESKPRPFHERYDVVYCAGVFDYMSDRICKRLMNIFYEMLEPGGLLCATNVDVTNPWQKSLEFLLEWHLIHRDSAQLRSLVPDQAPQDRVHFKRDSTGVNIFIEIRKPYEI